MRGSGSRLGVVLVAHGPASVTKAAIKRAHQLNPSALGLATGDGHEEGAETGDGIDVGRFATRVDFAARASGSSGIVEAIDALDADWFIVVHDDATVPTDALPRMRALDVAVAVATEDGRPGGCVAGPADAVAAAFSSGTGRGWTPAGGIVAGVAVRHDGRCAGDGSGAGLRVVANLIVRDEEALLGDCLASLSDVVDAIVVCDTGSVDATREVALGHGARVTEYRWNDHFGAARNAALQAVGPTDWVLWLDADERFECDDVEALRAELAGTDAEVLAVEVRSTRSDAPSSLGLMGRIFRPSLRFEGALHEQIVRVDGSAPRIERLQHARIKHLGYDESVVDVRGKAERNVAVAQRAYDRGTTAKTALDYARSMALVGRDPLEVLDVLDVALDRAPDRDPIRAAAASMAAGVALGVDEQDRALRYAGVALDLDPGNDVAALVIARAHPDHTEVLGRLTRFVDADQGSLRIDQNRSEALLRGALAAATLGQLETSIRFIAAASECATATEAAAFSPLFDRLEPDDRRRVIEMLPSRARGFATALLDRPHGAGSPGPTAPSPPPETASGRRGISLPPDVGSLPCETAHIAGMVYRGDRLLDFSGVAELAAMVDGHSREVVRIDPGQRLLSELETLRAGGARFDFAIGPLFHDTGLDIAQLVLALLDPAGRALFWDLNRDGFVVTESVRAMYDLSGGDGTATPCLADVGFVPAPGAPNATRLFRPALDRIDLSKDRAVESAETGSLTIVSPQPLSEELRIGYRLAVPATWALGFGTPTESILKDPHALVLHTDETIFPDPSWVGPLMQAAHVSGEPVGARVVGADGRHVHAGLTDDGRNIGFGDPAGLAVLASDRTATRLAAPFIVPAGTDATAHVSGRLVAAAMAVSPPVQETVVGLASLSELHDDVVLLIGGPAPGIGESNRLSAITKAAGRLAEAGHRVVYQWDPDELPPDPRHLELWRSAGIVVIPPPAPGLLSNQFIPDARAPRSDALALAFDPKSIVCLSRGAVTSDFALIADRAPHAFTLYAGSEDLGDLADRLDACVELDAMADAVLNGVGVERRAGRSAVDIPTIEPTVTRPGHTSIVIPVFNKWELTEACLTSIAEHTPEPHDVVIVDNGSSDATSSELTRSAHTVVTNAENLGFPTAVNQGIAAATGEYVCVLNNDTEVTPGWLGALHRTLAVPGTELVGPRSNEITGLQRVPDAPSMDEPADAHRWARDWIDSAGERSWQIARLVGFCMLARRSTFESIGGFDQGFGIGNYEDDELGNRIQSAGGALRVADGSVVLHHGSATFRLLGLDYAAVMHDAARHLGARTSQGTGVASVIVLSDGSGERAARAAVSAMYAADRVRIVERSALLSTQLAAAAVRGVTLEVVHADWTNDDGSTAAFDDLGGSVVVVLGANEQIVADDWGSVRAELETVDGSLAVVAPGGPETRVVPPRRDAIGLVGTPSLSTARTFRFVGQS